MVTAMPDWGSNSVLISASPEKMEEIEKLRMRVEKDPNSRLFLPLAEEYRKTGMLDEAISVILSGLSIEQYPFLAPPNIRVTATYPGASAVAVEQSVATPIEQEVNGVDRLVPVQLVDLPGSCRVRTRGGGSGTSSYRRSAPPMFLYT
jgi:hypothetical protein